MGVVVAGLLLVLSWIAPYVVLIEATIVLLIVIALRNSWDLLVTVGDVVVEDGRDQKT